MKKFRAIDGQKNIAKKLIAKNLKPNKFIAKN